MSKQDEAKNHTTFRTDWLQCKRSMKNHLPQGPVIIVIKPIDIIGHNICVNLHVQIERTTVIFC